MGRTDGTRGDAEIADLYRRFREGEADVLAGLRAWWERTGRDPEFEEWLKEHDKNVAVTTGFFRQTLLIVDASGGPATVRLPGCDIEFEKTVHVKKADATFNRVFVVPPSGWTIDGSDSVTLSLQFESVTLISSRTSRTWWLV